MRTSLNVLSLALGLLLLACDDEIQTTVVRDEVCLDGGDGNAYCIDRFEASRRDATRGSSGTEDDGPAESERGRLPWNDVTYFQARDACRRAEVRLCTIAEWEDACDGTAGDGGTTYVYGDERDASLCNVDGQGGSDPTGDAESCTGVNGTFDQGGNVWEWVGASAEQALVIGGGPSSDLAHRCTSGVLLPVVGSPRDSSTEFGFRCCRDL